MIYYSDAFLDSLLLEDIHYGDLTTRALGIGAPERGNALFPQAGRLCQRADIGSEITGKLGLQTQLHANDGDHSGSRRLLLTGNRSCGSTASGLEDCPECD